jgi:hypothetical protein
VNGQPPGSVIQVTARDGKLRYEGFLRSVVPIDHLELIVNGKVARTIRLERKQTTATFDGTLNVSGNGWLLVRAWNDGASPDILDLYPYATTNAFFFRTEGARTTCGPDAEYFLAWLARLESAAAAHEGYNTPQERETTLGEIRAAREVFTRLRGQMIAAPAVSR